MITPIIMLYILAVSSVLGHRGATTSKGVIRLSLDLGLGRSLALIMSPTIWIQLLLDDGAATSLMKTYFLKDAASSRPVQGIRSAPAHTRTYC